MVQTERKFSGSAENARQGLSLISRGGQRPRLLLAEDCDPVRVVTAAMLKGMGCDVDAVVHGEEAVRCAGSSRFDVIVLDIEMPVMDGITAARSIRRMTGAIRQTPLMALSAFLADAMQQASWSDTFDIALPKPANRNELHAAVKAALDWSPQDQSLRRFEEIPLLSDDGIARLKTGLSAAVLGELAAIACRDIEVCIDEIEAICSGERPGSVGIFAQKLVALGKTFAAPRLVAIAEHLGSGLCPEARVHGLMTLRTAAAATRAALRDNL